MGAKDTFNAWKKVAKHVEDVASKLGIEPEGVCSALWNAVLYRLGGHHNVADNHGKPDLYGAFNNIMYFSLVFSFANEAIDEDEWAWAQNAKGHSAASMIKANVAAVKSHTCCHDDIATMLNKVLPAMAEFPDAESCGHELLETLQGGACDYDW